MDVPFDPIELIVERFPDGIVFVFEEDDGIRYTFVDGEGLSALGLTKEELEGRPVAAGRPSAVRETVVPAYRRALDGEQVTFEIEAEGRHFRVELFPVPDETDDVPRGFGITRDVTEQVVHREELKRQNQRLEQLTQLVFHDLRGPLTVAQGRLKLLQEECDSDHIEPLESALDRIEELTEQKKAARSVRETAELDPIDLHSVAESAWQNVLTQSATLHVETDQTVRVDEYDLRRVLENLYRNAVLHGGGDVTVTVGSLETGFFVEDDGTGIPVELRDEVLKQGVSGGESTGLGLFIIKGIVDDYGWTVRVTESDSGGARFEFTGLDLVSE